MPLKRYADMQSWFHQAHLFRLPQEELAELEQCHQIMSADIFGVYKREEAAVYKKGKIRALHSKKYQGKAGKKTRQNENQFLDLAIMQDTIRRKKLTIRRLEDAYSRSQSSVKAWNEIVHSIITRLRSKQQPVPGCQMSESELTALNEQVAPTTVMGALFDHFFARTQSKGKRTQVPSVLMHFALTVANTSPAAYDVLRGCGLHVMPSNSTIIRENNSGAQESGVSEQNLNRLSELRPTLQESDCTGYLQQDDVSIQSGIEYNRRTGELIGFVEDSPLNVATHFNNTAVSYKEVLPQVATHCSMWFFRSYSGKVALPVCADFINEKDKVKAFDMARQLLNIITLLHTRTFKVTAICQDNHRSNQVST